MASHLEPSSAKRPRNVPQPEDRPADPREAYDFPPPKDVSSWELDASRGIYDRSSLTGDFMVILEDQTSEDFERYAPERQPCDYLEGRVYMPSPATERHQEQVGFFYWLLDTFRQIRGGWRVLLGPAVLRIDAEHKPEPDIFLVPNPPDPDFVAPAALVIEILSPSTRSHDLSRKLKTYKDAGIPEVWLLDERNRQLIAERRQGKVDHRQVYTSGPVVSSAIAGFWFDLDWLWQDPLPEPRVYMERILAGPPA